MCVGVDKSRIHRPAPEIDHPIGSEPPEDFLVRADSDDAVPINRHCFRTRLPIIDGVHCAVDEQHGDASLHGVLQNEREHDSSGGENPENSKRLLHGGPPVETVRRTVGGKI